MSLTKVQGSPGIWSSDQWSPGTPGLFAVVIGVSSYEHLAGGKTPAPQTYDLEQLSVSALTAYRIFEWLRDNYALTGCPLAQVWLLLAPTKAELDFEPRLADHTLAPTIDHCEQAIGQWHAAMKALPLAAAECSRSFFFFSGHGLEVHQDRQILLPTDYLSPPAHNVNNALSTMNLVHGLASLNVPRQFFFLDACRNDNQKLREKRIEGRMVLNEDTSGFVNADVIAPILYATASGQQAFQQPEPQSGLSLYGTALIDGLSGAPDIELKPINGHWAVNVFPLQRYVKSRIVSLLDQAQERVRQPLKLGGTSDDETITLAPKPKGLVATPPDVKGLALQSAIQVERALAAPFSVSRPVPEQYQRGNWAPVAHDTFGSEWATALWDNVQLVALSSGIDKSAAGLTLHRVDRDPGTRRFQVEISPVDADPLGHWLELNDGLRRYAALLPADRLEALRYVIDFDLEYKDQDAQGGRRVSRLAATLAPDLGGPVGIAARLWETYNASDAGTASQVMQDQQLAELLLSEKAESPLAAAIAALVLLRAGRLDLLHDWLRNLANWFPELPDGATLWSEQLLRKSRGPDAIVEAAQYTMHLAERGLPVLAETVSYTARHLELLAAQSSLLQPDVLRQIAALRERLGKALVYFRSDGLFPAFAGFDDRAQVLEPLGLGVHARHLLPG